MKVKILASVVGESLMYEADGTTLRGGSYGAIRDRVQAAISKAISDGLDMDLDGDNDAGTNGGCCGEYAWIQDLFPAVVVYSMGGDLFQCDYTDDGDTVTLGKPVEVEQSYTVVPGDATDATESHRALCAEVSQFKEAAFDAKTGSLTITVIKPGLNTSGERYYPPEVLKRDYKIFEGAKMFADHQTEADNRQRPEGSVHNWVASVKKVWAESDGVIKAKADVIDPPFKAKLEELDKKGLLSEMGVSIRAIGEAAAGKINGVKTNIVESLLRARSVDFVTYAGAGGAVEAIESAAANSEHDVDLVSEAELRQRRPDLVELIESHTQGDRMKTLETQLQEANTALVAANTKLAEEKKRADEATTKLQEAEKTSKKATAQAELTKLLTEAAFPEKVRKVVEDRIRKQFAEATEVAGMKEAIDAEKEYIKSLGGSGKVVNMGERHNGSSETKVDLKESSQKLLGLTKEEAELFAAGR